MRYAPPRKVIGLSKTQPDLDFDNPHYLAEFTLPAYQRRLLLPRTFALLTDLILVFTAYLIFVAVTMMEMPAGMLYDRRMLGVYAGAYLVLTAAYFALFMLSTGQTTGMYLHRLIAVGRHGAPLTLPEAFLRGFGYAISILPALLGFLWAFIDTEHLTWADKVSGTFIKRL